MENRIISELKSASKLWWVSLLIGILAIVVGIWSMLSPDVTLVALVYVFIVSFFVSGIFDIVFAISVRKEMRGWGWSLAGGIIDLVFSILLLFLPQEVVALVLIYYVGFWLLFRSVWSIGIACELTHVGGSVWLVVLAVLGLLFSFFYLFSPAFGSMVVVALASLGFISYGVFRIYYGFRLKSMNKKLKNL